MVWVAGVAWLMAGCGANGPGPVGSPQEGVSSPTVGPAATGGVASPVTEGGAGPADHATTPVAAATPMSAAAASATPTAPPPKPVVVTPPPPPAMAVSIKAAGATLDAVASGRKTSTTRRGRRDYPLGPAVLASGTRQLRVTITKVDVKRARDLTAADAAGNGSASLADYRAALAHDYPGLGDDDTVSVVHVAAAR